MGQAGSRPHPSRNARDPGLIDCASIRRGGGGIWDESPRGCSGRRCFDVKCMHTHKATN